MNDVFSCDAVVIGAGVVGLAIARKLSMAGHDTMILEKNEHFGMETSARNSEVIHAGIYYPKNSLKARFCLAGRDQLYAFCASHGVGYKKLGKLIVATHPDQGSKLADIAKSAAQNGVGDLRPISKADIKALEPDLSAVEGLFSPSTGIIDSHQYMLALLGGVERHGGTLVRKAEVTAIAKMPEGYALTVANDGETFILHARILINSAGLWAQHAASLIDALPRRFLPPLRLAKGNYAILSAPSPFRHLVYPVPEPGGLGVHLTLDMGGQARFGPNVQWLESNDPAKIDYAVSPSVPKTIAPLIARYWPGIREDMLAPGYSGVRPKTAGPENPNQDFQIDGPEVHGLPGLVNLFAMESPGLTSSLAIADHVAELVA
jgi:L-2-hydroxyglutarate oxidase LhgO